jgi:hypothetical protein
MAPAVGTPTRAARTPGPLLSAASAGLFGALSRLRGKRIFHPHGVSFDATLTPLATTATGSQLFDDPAPRPAVARLSRSLGLPDSLNDPCGLALRVPDAYGDGRHQDFLLVTSGRSPGARHLLLPSRGFSSRTYSSLLPYRVAGALALVGADPVGPAPGPGAAELRRRDPAGLGFLITLAGLTGEWEPVARLDVGPRLSAERSEALRFNPAHTGGGMELAGFLNDLRAPAYRGSQEGRRRARTDQERAMGARLAERRDPAVAAALEAQGVSR